ncbi:MAG: FHA domain-containing protein [Bacteroidales bacterium]|nr:FHA domain-containing protein [Bacteroidales bacterium]
MEKNELFIGREVEKGDYPIDKQYALVGRKHARMTRMADGLYIEDLDSANGTYVNGTRVSRKKINTSDKVTLGGIDHFQLNIGQALKLLPMSAKEFQTKFTQLKHVYANYQKEKVKIQSESQGKMMLKRSIPMALPGLVMVVVPFFLDKNSHDVKLLIQMSGGILSALSMVIGSIWASKSMAKVPERLNDLRERFLIDYVCPDCGNDFGERPWENIKRQGKCKACQRDFGV